MKIIRYPAGVYAANCYIVYDETSNDGFIIDPGGNAYDILENIKNENIKIGFIILTHGHGDHTGGVNVIKKELNVPVYMNKNDMYLVDKDHKNYVPILPNEDSIYIDEFLMENDALKFGNEMLYVIETPGHTPGSITIRVNDVIFTGDTLFSGSVGRSDLPGGSHYTLIKSIKDKLLILPDKMVVYPGHGPSTTIGKEKIQNPYL